MARHYAAALPLVLALGGCFSSTTIIRLNADGSGEMEQAVLINARALEGAMVGMGQAMGGSLPPGQTPSPADMFNEATLRAGAARLGPGVRYVASSPLVSGDMEGARATYAFDDINTLVIPDVPGQPPHGGASGPLSFRLAPHTDGHSVLTITIPDMQPPGGMSPMPIPDSGAAQPGSPEGASPEMLAAMTSMMSELMNDMNITVQLELNGRLLRSTSPHVAGSRVTLLEMDIGRLVAQMEAGNPFGDLNPGTADFHTLMAKVPGMRLNKSPVVIEFAPP